MDNSASTHSSYPTDVILPHLIITAFPGNCRWIWWVWSRLSSCYNLSSPYFTAAAGVLGACCHDYHPTTPDQSHLSLVGLFMTTMLPQLVVPVFHCICRCTLCVLS